uniref:Multiple epidermal growth factor-like domains protein 8 n=1 Tax=Callorhinchus milii TaxID=7868 RepID=A0A4W3GEN1_CALMI|eukprot:gi/632992010/ref/XP_007884883.1/ PREDICTED: multiple epidermal growth factor-like domains protein 8 [Callorhinchus milii]
MVALGGRTAQRDFTSDVLIYQLTCNTWVSAQAAGSAVLGDEMSPAIGHAVARLGDGVYVSGGYGGLLSGRMVRLSLPGDPCLLYTGPDACNSSNSSCVWVQADPDSACLSTAHSHR